MRIEKVYVENFRCIKEAEILFDDATSFVGRNGVGKSTILYALDSFYTPSTQYSKLDYYGHNSELEIKIRVTYGSLREDELKEFSEYIKDNKLVVSKKINSGGARYYGASAQIPIFADARKVPFQARRTLLKETFENGELPGLAAIPNNAAALDVLMAEYESAHPDMQVPIERETQFFGSKNVGGGKLDNFTKFVLVPAVRDASNEMEKRGAIMQLLDLIVTRSIANREDFQKFKTDFEAKAKELYGKDNLPELTKLGESVSERLRRYSPGADLSIDFEELKPPSIPLPDATVSVSEDNFSVPVRYTGHGLQRAVVLSLLEQLSLTPVPQVNPANTDTNTENANFTDRIPDLILAIEEPELYLHPARSRYLAKILRGLAIRAEDALAPSTQVLYVTHSPYFLEVQHFNEIRICRKTLADPATAPRHTAFTQFSKKQAAEELARIWERPAEEFTEQAFVSRAAPVLNTIVNEGFFADVVVVVEGESDVAALWAMQELMSAGWDQLGIVLIPVGGKNNLDRAVVAFRGFGISTYFIFDGDKVENKTAHTNRAYTRMGGLDSIDYPSTLATPDFAVFENDIETYLQSCVGERFAPLRGECAAALSFEKPSKALKNSEVMELFFKKSIEEGFKFPVLEEIVNQITNKAHALVAAV
ncbi:ATP-dependent nuclease [Variovorax boronicumulans]|uniref:ATP-dependent nuclease n=1 Tax=Variovorax boronicumulans TaxID=436515 RepID=UPI0027863D39|nr:AAA family ATPase [Variovorax boronicumulans]MDQ0043577.1 energy-coupling factor transporter ATP-binding protein EcfA2 [Variovorax boronicumulans]